MPILDAALAFALTMLVVATAVTQIVNFLQKLAKLRNTELRKLLSEFFERDLEPVVTRELCRLNQQAAGKISSELVATAKDCKLHFPDADLDALVEVSTEELAERLKRSELGQKLLKELGDEANKIFGELGRRFETVGEKFTKSFREHSRRWATLVALILALAVNIDSLRIAKAYIRSGSLREDIVAQMNAVVDKYDATVAGQDDADLRTDAKALQERVADLTKPDLPIGWSYFPYNLLQSEDVSRDGQHRTGWVMWGLGILLTALLAGLGAPFWYDAVTGISRFAQRARAVKTSTT